MDSISSDEKLLPHLTHEILQAAAELFAIRLWLEGADDQLYGRHHIYKHPIGYAEFLKKLKSGNERRLMVKMVLTDFVDDRRSAS